MATIAVIGTLDSKGHEHQFVADQIRSAGHSALLVDVGTLGETQVAPDIKRDEILEVAGLKFGEAEDRGERVGVMAKALPIYLNKLVEDGKIDGVISLGGGGGTAISTAGMRALPIGFPKLMVSTLASGNTAHYVGTNDIVMFPSIVDVAGLNQISKTIFARAAGAICGMAKAKTSIVEEKGYEVLVFPATGTGGKTMESLIESGMVKGVLDITTTEWADELTGATLSAGPARLEATGKAGIPAIVTPGCLDMANFGEPDTVPEKYEGRNFYHHNPQVTLMRTNAEECSQLGKILAEKVNAYTAPVTVLLPAKAISIISAEGQPFYDAEADAALFSAIKENLFDSVELIEVDAEINAPEFSNACAEALLKNLAG